MLIITLEIYLKISKCEFKNKLRFFSLSKNTIVPQLNITEYLNKRFIDRKYFDNKFYLDNSTNPLSTL